MKVAVLGLWHLGSVTAACTAAAGHQVAAWDPDAGVLAQLRQALPPVAEPDLAPLIAAELKVGRLRFETDLAAALTGAEVVWMTFDTPVDEDDHADVAMVLDQVRRALPLVPEEAIVLLSSQLPVGSVRRLERELAAMPHAGGVAFACAPENLRLGSAVTAFRAPDRCVIGIRDERAREVLTRLFEPITPHLEWMSVESAEMTKHAINAFLATSVAFINEIAVLAERVGADAKEIERGLKSERRIGPRAYLSPGGAFAGGTLARDVAFLDALGVETGVPTPLVSGIRASNDQHRGWTRQALGAWLPHLRGARVAVWGLTYKPGTDTLRRSSSVELCQWLSSQGAEVVAYDPAIDELPDSLRAVLRLAPDALAAAAGAEALVVATEWPDFRRLGADEVVAALGRPLVCDANRFLAASLGSDPRVCYLTVGRPQAQQPSRPFEQAQQSQPRQRSRPLQSSESSKSSRSSQS